MKTPLRRIAAGAVVLVMTVALATLAYHQLGRPWIESLYMVVITIATVGYGERSSASPTEQLLTIAVILVGISASAYALGGLVQMMLEGEIDRIVGGRSIQREIDKLRNHVIVCGYGRIGQILAAELQQRKIALVVIDSDASVGEEAADAGYRVRVGDATEDEVLIAAGVRHARALVTCLPSDAANVFITLTSRNLHRDLRIIARGEFPSTQNKLLQAGADQVVLPAATGAQRIAAMLTRPSTFELLELTSQQGSLDVEMDEIALQPGSLLPGKSVKESLHTRRHGLLLVAVKQPGGSMVFNPDPDFVFSSGDILIVLGSAATVEQFRREIQPSEPPS